MPRPNDVGVGIAAVVIRNRRILLLKRKGAHAEGAWAVPGGWVDREDECPRNCVSRELLEEVGLDLVYYRLLDVTSEDHEELGCRSVTIYYEAIVASGDEPTILEPEKCSELRWFSFEEIAEGDRTAGYTPLIPLFPNLFQVILQLHDSYCL